MRERDCRLQYDNVLGSIDALTHLEGAWGLQRPGTGTRYTLNSPGSVRESEKHGFEMLESMKSVDPNISHSECGTSSTSHLTIGTRSGQGRVGRIPTSCIPQLGRRPGKEEESHCYGSMLQFSHPKRPRAMNGGSYDPWQV